MADTKISALAQLAAGNGADADELVIVDKSDATMAASGTDKRVTLADLARLLSEGGRLKVVEQAEPSTPGSTEMVLWAEDVSGKSRLYMKGSDGIVVAPARDAIALGYNNTAGSLSAYSLIYFSGGATGGVPHMDLARADSATTMPCVGVLMETTGIGAVGRVMMMGRLGGLNLGAFSGGDRLYVSPTVAGGFTTTAPLYPDLRQRIAVVAAAVAAPNGAVDILFGTVDDRVAGALQSATTEVQVNNATAPTSGQVLTATSGTAATWQTPGGGAPGGANTAVQYNNAGAFGGNAAAFWWNNGSQVLGLDGFLNLARQFGIATPSADQVNLMGRNIAGRMLPAFVGPSGLDSALQPFIARNKIAFANPVGNATTLNNLGIALSATGTATTANVATTNVHTAIKRLEYAVTTASATAVAGFRSTSAQYHIGAGGTIYGGFTFVCRFGPSRGVASNATRRFFVGLSSLTAAPTDAEPSTVTTNAIGVGADAADTNWQIIHRNASAGATKIDTGFAKGVADTSEMYELALFTSPAGSTVGYEFTRLSDGAVFSGTISTNLPAVTTLLAPRGWTSVGGTSSAVGIALASLYLETDY